MASEGKHQILGEGEAASDYRYKSVAATVSAGYDPSRD